MKQKKEKLLEIKNNSAITLIALVITILVLLILTGVTISTLTGENGLFGKTTEAGFKSEIKQYEEELRLKIAEEEVDALGNREDVINVFKNFPSTGEENENFEEEMKENIPSFNNSKYGNKLEIRNDELIYTDEENLQERKWFSEVQLSLSKYFITVNYVDKQGNILAEPETISTTTGLYEIEPKVIEGHEAERPLYEGITKEDTEITITYLPESVDLAYIGLDESGYETEDESEIVTYTVAGIGNFKGEDLVIPRTYSNKPVTQIKENAFKDNDTLKTLIIPQTIKIVNKYAFYSSKLKYISLNAEIVKFPYALESEIEKLDIGKNVKNIEGSTFRGCNLLSDVSLYSENIQINAEAFPRCANFKQIKVNVNNNSYRAIDGILYSIDGKTLYLYPPGKDGENYLVSNTVQEIGECAMAGNLNLKKVEIPSSVKRVSRAAFQGSNNIEYIKVDAEIIDNYYNFGWLNLKKIDIGKNVKYLGSSIFQGNNSIEEVNYLGTMNEWNSINKMSNWNYGTNIMQIKCTDGVINM